MNYYLIMFFIIFPIAVYSAQSQEEIIANYCRARKLVTKPTPSASPLAQAIDAEEAAEEEQTATQESTPPSNSNNNSLLPTSSPVNNPYK